MITGGNKMKNLKKLRIYWILWFLILIVSAYIIPYQFIGGISKITASFLFWTVFAIFAIISTLKIITYWRD